MSQTSPVVLCMQNSVISIGITSLYGSQPSSVVLWMQNSDSRTRITSLLGSQTLPVVLSMQNSVISTWITSLYGSQPSSVVFASKIAMLDHNYKSLWVPDLTCRFLHANSMISTRITSLYGFQPSSVVLCIQNSDVKTKFLVSMGPRHHLWSSACKTMWITPK